MDLDYASRFGPLLRRARSSRGLSQERLARDAEVSPRHLSFLETGRAAPSREMVLVLASALDLPLRDRNALLVAAGFVPVYSSAPFESVALEPVRRALDHLLRAHEPFGAIVVDRDWNVLQMNAGAQRLFAWALGDLRPPPEVLGNLLRATFDPAALRSRIVNFADVATTLVDRVERALALETDDDRRARLGALIDGLPDRPPRGATPSDLPVLPVVLRRGESVVRLFTTLTTLGTALDVTADELHIESYFPADTASDRFLRELANRSS